MGDGLDTFGGFDGRTVVEDPAPGALAPNQYLLEELFYFASDFDVRLVFTFLTLGGGEGSTTKKPGDGTDYDSSMVEYTDSVVAPGAEIDWNGQSASFTREFAPLEWSHDHIGRAAGSGVHFPVTSGPVVAGHNWFFESIDPACPYKRIYLGKIASEVADMLISALIWSETPTSRFPEAIEIFNEVDVRDFWEMNSTPQMGAAGEKWGRAYLHAAWNFRAAFNASSWNFDDVQIWMPGISSYHSITGLTWQAKLEFVDGFVAGMVAEAQERPEDVTNGAESVPAELLKVFPDLLQGIDLHWYHREAGQDLRHIGYLVFEIDELRQAVTGAVRTHNIELEEDTLEAAFGDAFPVSVFENGWGLDDQPPMGAGPLSPPNQGMFQAAEVWRRIGGAIAGGASIAGWHSWMSKQASSFSKMGLRADAQNQWDPASDATQRISWFAYAILAEILGDRVIGGGMVLPDVTSRTELGYHLKADPDHVGVVVFEYRLQAGGRAEQWAYMVLRDPSTAHTGGSVYALGRRHSSAAGVVSIEGHQISYSTSLVITGSTEDLPRVSWNAANPTSHGLPLAVAPSWVPRLFVSTKRLSWSVGSSPVVGRGVNSVPDWMDDPSVPFPGSGTTKIHAGLGGHW
jgi:hypothetical protein